MTETNLPIYANKFTQFRVLKAICQTHKQEEEIVLEFRSSADEKEKLFTIVDGKAFHVDSIYTIINSLPDLIAIRVPHQIRILWGGNSVEAEVIEVFLPSTDPDHIYYDTLQLILKIEDKVFNTEPCDTLTDAISELHEVTEEVGEGGDWRLCTCFNCEFAGYARKYSNSDREYWCYRDVEEDQWKEIKSKRKFANPEAKFAGKYFVDAFHFCAAWTPKIRKKKD